MTNEDVIKQVCGHPYYQHGCWSIPKEMDDFIRENYTKGDDNGPFYKVYREGNDAKYGHYMINPRTMKWRNSTFDEFYAGGIVD